MKELVFGLDIGTNSIGYAVVELDAETGSGKIAEKSGMGVRVFPEPRDEKTKTPRNQVRRQKRMMRRQLRRRKARRRNIGEILVEMGLLPHFSKDKNSEWMRVMTELDPYELRHRGLTEKLSAFEFGRALYHLSKRRHFKGGSLTEAENKVTDEDEKKAAKARDSLVAELEVSGQTLGSYLHLRDDVSAKGVKGRFPVNRRRGHHATRAHVMREFNALWEKQREFHGKLEDDGIKATIEDAIFSQRPVFWRTSTLGQCRFIPGAPLCPKGSWLSQQRRLLEKINNLAFSGGNGRPLDDDERRAILSALEGKKSITWQGARKALASLYEARGMKGAEKKLKFNFEDAGNGDKGLVGNHIEASLSAIFSNEWKSHPYKQHIRDGVEAVRSAGFGMSPIKGAAPARIILLDPAESIARKKAAAAHLAKSYGMTSAQEAAISEMIFESGWEPFSTEALEKFLSELERGARMGSLLMSPEWEAWRDDTFPRRDRPTGEFYDFLPSPKVHDEQLRLNGIRNPTVVRVQNELRKVVNNLIRVHGHPDKIRVELARDLGMGAKQIAQQKARNEAREKLRAKARQDLTENGINPTPRQIEKWLLWDECGHICPYTRRPIGFDALFADGEFEIEHIWPRSRSLDDSMANKTLCARAVNQEKNNRTPYEAFGADEDRWDAIKANLSALRERSKFPESKVKRFLAKDISQDFANSQLSDTSYAAREAIASLKRLWPDVGVHGKVTVQAVSGRVTAHLRRLWGLNFILSNEGSKTREDHRHHAVDALTVACSHPGVVHVLSRYWRMREEGFARDDIKIDMPWSSIRQDADREVSKIVVSHKAQRKISGALHKEGTYGLAFEGESNEEARFVSRKSVESLGNKGLEDIRDESVKQIVKSWVETHGGDPKKAFSSYPRISDEGPEIKKVRTLMQQKKSVMHKVSDSGYAQLGSNHHIGVYRTDTGKIIYQVTSMMEAATRVRRQEPIVRKMHEGAKLILSLAIGDTVLFPEGEKAGYWVVKSVWEGGQVALAYHTDARPAKERKSYIPTVRSLVNAKVEKVAVDPIGRVRHAGG